MSAGSPTRYTAAAKIIHWLMAALIIVMVFYGWSMDNQEGAELAESLSYHALGGILVFAFVILRLSWRVANPPPALPETLSDRQRIAAKSVHVALYVLMFLVPLTGLVAGVAHELPVIIPGNIDIHAAFGFLGKEGFDLKREIHAQTMHLLVALIIGHIGAALVHQFWLKDGLMRRMLTEKSSG